LGQLLVSAGAGPFFSPVNVTAAVTSTGNLYIRRTLRRYREIFGLTEFPLEIQKYWISNLGTQPPLIHAYQPFSRGRFGTRHAKYIIPPRKRKTAMQCHFLRRRAR
jgi:hypothetical protein